MTKLCLTCVILCIVLLQPGCSDTESTPGLGFIPKIRQAAVYNINDPEKPTTVLTLTLGDKVDFSVRAEDGDLDLKAIWATEYLLDEEEETETLFNGPEASALSKQTSQIMTYRNLFPKAITGPLGAYRIYFQVEDVRGNKSEPFFISYTVE